MAIKTHKHFMSAKKMLGCRHSIFGTLMRLTLMALILSLVMVTLLAGRTRVQTIRFKGYDYGCPVDENFPDNGTTVDGEGVENDYMVGPDKEEDGTPKAEVDAAGNKIEVFCMNDGHGSGHGAFYIRFTPAGGGAAVWIGRCSYHCGENTTEKELDDGGNITKVTHYNYEGTLNNHDGIHVADDNSIGVLPGYEERVIFTYTVSDNKLALKHEKRKIKDDGTKGDGEFAEEKSSAGKAAPTSHSALRQRLIDEGITGGKGDFADADPAQEGYPHMVALEATGTAYGGSFVHLNIVREHIADSTYEGLQAGQIIADLIYEINSNSDLTDMGIFAELGENANIMVIANVLDEDVVFTSDDKGIVVRQYGNPHIPVTSLTEWGLIILMILLLVSGLWILACYRKSVIVSK
jgi:hypothetical protein